MKNQEIIFKTFPVLFDMEKAKVWPINLFGIECDEGWYNIIHNLSYCINSLLMQIPEEEREDYYVVQIKEKFGGLRWYMNDETKEMTEHIQKAEDMSYKVCETCGKPGEPRKGGWIKTLCDICFENRYR